MAGSPIVFRTDQGASGASPLTSGFALAPPTTLGYGERVRDQFLSLRQMVELTH